MNPNLVFVLSLLFIIIGYGLKKLGILESRDGQSLSKLIMNLTLPALIFRTISRAEISASSMYLPLSAILFGTVVCSTLLFLNRKAAPEDKAIYSLGSIGFNNGMFAFPIIEGVYGSVGLGFLAIFDIGSGLSVFGVSYMLAAYFNAKRLKSDYKMSVAKFFGMILKSVPFMSYILAIAWNLSGFAMPPFADSVLAVPARANMVLVLILIGLHLEFSLEGSDRKKILGIFSLRYGLGIAIGIVMFFMPVADETLKGVLMILFILPISMAAIPYATLFNFDTKTAGVLVNYSIIISFILMWIGINLSRLG